MTIHVEPITAIFSSRGAHNCAVALERRFVKTPGGRIIKILLSNSARPYRARPSAVRPGAGCPCFALSADAASAPRAAAPDPDLGPVPGIVNSADGACARPAGLVPGLAPAPVPVPGLDFGLATSRDAAISPDGRPLRPGSFSFPRRRPRP